MVGTQKSHDSDLSDDTIRVVIPYTGAEPWLGNGWSHRTFAGADKGDERGVGDNASLIVEYHPRRRPSPTPRLGYIFW